MERLDYHNGCNEVTMESRIFRIVPVQRGAEIEVIDVLQKQIRLPNSWTNCKCNEEEDDDALVIAVPAGSNASSSRKLWETYSRKFPNAIHSNTDARDDEASTPIVLRSYNRKEHRSARSHQQSPQDHTNTPTETEKRIAQLRSAGLSISSRGITSPRSQKVQGEERDAPPSSPVSEGRSKKSSALQALLEKDSMHQQRYLACSPPLPRSLQKWSKTSTFFPSVSPPSFLKLARDTPVDPIIAARPSYKGLRVSLRDYPDPSSFGWAFVGGCLDSEVEYFEKVCSKGKVVLEFHYTTGTVRATLQQRNNGESLLAYCVGGLSSKIYRKILLDPLGCSKSGMSL
mmetsp:Transcript_4019/g.9577  ORF Transcript_4019/g.9577 Transcript_4019/m.9577 type:complete len:343 (-) Transcript_4019:82-1110(-)